MASVTIVLLVSNLYSKTLLLDPVHERHNVTNTPRNKEKFYTANTGLHEDNMVTLCLARKT